MAEVILVHPTTALHSDTLRGKLDTGASLTIIPERFVSEMGLLSHGEVWVRSYDGTYARRPQYYVRLTVERHELPASPCVAVPRETVLLGRDVLNRFNIVLDGRNLRFTLGPA